MPNMNKKGLSNIIAAIIFIVLSMSSALLLYNALIPFLRSPEAQLSPFLSCTQMQQNPVQITNIETEQNQLLIALDIPPTVHESISSLEFLISYNDETTEKRSCGLACGEGHCLIKPGNKEYLLEELQASGIEKISVFTNTNCLNDERTFS